MTENEAKYYLLEHKPIVGFKTHNEALDVAIQALEEIQQYRAIGTVEELIKEHKELIELSRRYLIDTNELLEYQAIGTVEQLKAIKQWKSDVMEDFCRYDASSFEEIIANARAKAIDEFAEKLKNRLIVMQIRELRGKDVCPCAKTGEECPYINQDIGCQYCAREHTIKEVNEIAERLKAGGKNED